MDCAFVRGAPYSLTSGSTVIAGSSRSYLVDCTKPITPTPSGTVVSLPFLRGHTTLEIHRGVVGKVVDLVTHSPEFEPR